MFRTLEWTLDARHREEESFLALEHTGSQGQAVRVRQEPGFSVASAEPIDVGDDCP